MYHHVVDVVLSTCAKRKHGLTTENLLTAMVSCLSKPYLFEGVCKVLMCIFWAFKESYEQAASIKMSVIHQRALSSSKSVTSNCLAIIACCANAIDIRVLHLRPFFSVKMDDLVISMVSFNRQSSLQKLSHRFFQKYYSATSIPILELRLWFRMGCHIKYLSVKT